MKIMAGPNLDPINVVQYLASLAIDPNIAAIVGPYSVIILASIGGVAASLANDKTLTKRSQAFWFLLRGIFASLLLTVPVATFVATYSEAWQAQWFFIPAAIVLSYASGKWKQILDFGLGLAKKWITNWVTNKSQQ